MTINVFITPFKNTRIFKNVDNLIELFRHDKTIQNIS